MARFRVQIYRDESLSGLYLAGLLDIVTDYDPLVEWMGEQVDGSGTFQMEGLNSDFVYFVTTAGASVVVRISDIHSIHVTPLDEE